MKIRLKRVFKGNNYTIGNLSIDGKFECDTLEDPDRGLTSSMSLEEIKSKKVYGNTAIPCGMYKVDMGTVSPKFKDRAWAKFCNGKLPRLIDVKGYEGVLIHVGNKPEDTLGCILLGENKTKGQIINSTSTFERVYNKLLNVYKSGEQITLEIV